MKVSGDMESLRNYLQRQKDHNNTSSKAASSDQKEELKPMPCEWNYMEDIALSMPENSSEYRDLLMKKGREEIDKRKVFLLGAQGSLTLLKDTNLVTHPQSSSQQDVMIKTKCEDEIPAKERAESAVKGADEDDEMKEAK